MFISYHPSHPEEFIAISNPLLRTLASQHTSKMSEQTVTITTAPRDKRFPTTNQTKHCWARYLEFHACTKAKGEDDPECEKFQRWYKSLCPSEWVSSFV